MTSSSSQSAPVRRSSSSSSFAAPPKGPEPLTIVVAPMELLLVHTNSDEVLDELKELAAKYQMNPAELIAQGLVQVFRGPVFHIGVRDAGIHLVPQPPQD